ncbi:hypothetical protein CISIN_1g043357mg [Citrus sinensis]|uniref:Knottin scorpion toxin-like domain-containing protein n=1 Tax=Citrus sinensis TaxID=2711 RepID=A0A067DLA9_CITSI|nr:hypothetical protein CISIN_1g043357mg [Citrus sinensis]
MAQTKVLTYTILLALLLCMLSASKCCRNYHDLGKCLPGADDKPNTGKCWKFCSTECKGAKCQLLGHRHQCHCLC